MKIQMKHIVHPTSIYKRTLELYGVGCVMLSLAGAWSAGANGQGVWGGIVIGVLMLIGLPICYILPILTTLYYARALTELQIPNLRWAWILSFLTIPASIFAVPPGCPARFTALYIGVALAGAIPIGICLYRLKTLKYVFIPLSLLALFIAQLYLYFEILIHV